MSSKKLQKTKATKDKRAGQVRLQRNLAPWINEIVSSYRIGDRVVSTESITDLSQTLRKFYITTSKDVLTFDIREHKQNEEDVTAVLFTEISRSLDHQFVNRLPNSVRSITNTSNGWTSRTTQLAITNEWSQREADAALTNYLKNQRLTVAVTESQWTVETTRKVAVVSVRDPLGNSMENMIRFIESGDMNAATRLGRKVNKLSKLPTSVSQGKLIRLITSAPENSRVVSPLTQAEAITNLRRQARALDKKGKQWETLGVNVRATHEAANGQVVDNIEEPFILAGGALQYPGDASLGASLDEIINCHCVSIYI